MNGTGKFDPNLPISFLVQQFPQTIQVFTNRKMMCVGCSMASFTTPLEAAKVYQIQTDEFLRELKQAINGKAVSQ